MTQRRFMKSFPFSVDSRVAIQLGRESISNSFVAITELVKNAYDADAEEVKIRFINLSESSETLIIEDDGNGMDSTTLIENWMRIGSDMKVRADRSVVKHRVVTGSKGLGRLGIDRLCNKLILQSKTDKSQTGIELEIDWNKYEISYRANLEEIEHDTFEIPGKIQDALGQFPIGNKMKGTRLILTGLKDNWTEELCSDLKKELSRLVSPFQGIKDFEIKLSSGYPKIDGKVVSKQYLRAAEWKLHSMIDKDSMVSIEVSSSRFRRSFKEGPTAWKEWIKGRGDVPSCGALRLEMHYIPSRSEKIMKSIDFDRGTIDDFVRNNQGLRIYRDKFRVKPYGEPSGDGDWLTLQHRRATQPQSISQAGWRVALHQIVGAVFITRAENPGLLDQTNREGLVESQPFFDLRAFAEKSVRFFETQVHLWAKEQKDKTASANAKNQADLSTSESFNAIKDLKAQVTTLSGTIQNNVPSISTGIAKEVLTTITRLENSISESAKYSKNYEDLLETETQALQMEKDTLSNLASLGILTVSFGHETKGAANVASANAKTLMDKYVVGKNLLLPENIKSFTGYLERIQRNTAFVNAFANFALENIKWDKRKRRLLYLNDLWNYVNNSFSLSLDKKNISIDDKGISSDLPAIRGFIIDWESIFVNLISNSVWAMEDTPAAKRAISIKMYTTNNIVHVNFADSGKGLEKGTENMIFMPTFSTKRNEKGEQIGTGMGLSIVKSFVEDHANGSMFVKSPGRLGGAEFDIHIPAVKKRGK